MIEFGCEFGQNVVDTRKGFRVTSASHRMNLCGGAPDPRADGYAEAGQEKHRKALDTNV